MTFERSLVSGLSFSLVVLVFGCSQGSTLARGGTGGGGNNTGSGGLYNTGGTSSGSGGYATGGTTPGSGGYATGGTTTGSGGLFATGGSSTTCSNAVGAGSTPLIDDLTDNDNAITQTDNRIGYWYDYSDGTTGGTLTPPNASFLPSDDGTGNLAVHVVATGFATWGAGFGFGLENTCLYDASAYTGVSFRIKGSGAIRFQVTIPATTSTTSNPTSGACAAQCDDHFGKDITPTADWTTQTFTWAQLAQGGWGAAATFMPNQLIALQWQINGSATAPSAGDVWIDDVSFTK